MNALLPVPAVESSHPFAVCPRLPQIIKSDVLQEERVVHHPDKLFTHLRIVNDEAEFVASVQIWKLARARALRFRESRHRHRVPDVPVRHIANDVDCAFSTESLDHGLNGTFQFPPVIRSMDVQPDKMSDAIAHDCSETQFTMYVNSISELQLLEGADDMQPCPSDAVDAGGQLLEIHSSEDLETLLLPQQMMGLETDSRDNL